MFMHYLTTTIAYSIPIMLYTANCSQNYNLFFTYHLRLTHFLLHFALFALFFPTFASR